MFFSSKLGPVSVCADEPDIELDVRSSSIPHDNVIETSSSSDGSPINDLTLSQLTLDDATQPNRR